MANNKSMIKLMKEMDSKLDLRPKKPGSKFIGTVKSVGELPLITGSRMGDYAYVVALDEFWIFRGKGYWAQMPMLDDKLKAEIEKKAIQAILPVSDSGLKRIQADMEKGIAPSIPVRTVCVCCRKNSKIVHNAPLKLGRLKADDKKRAKLLQRIEAAGYSMDNDDQGYLVMEGGYDDCFVGLVEQFGQQPRICYDLDKVLDVLFKDFRPDIIKDIRKNYPELSKDEKEMMADDEARTGAQEWYDYNIIGGWNGEGTPVFIRTLNEGAI